MIFEHTDYRAFLKAELAARIAANPAFSLRAFSRVLEMAPATLSQVLRSHKNLSPESAARVARKLGLPEGEAAHFSLLVQLETTRDPDLRASILARLRLSNPSKPAVDLSVDAFKAIADWYHLPILMMTQLADFELTAQGAASRLGITRLEAEVAIERLIRLELLRRAPNGSLVRDEDYWMVSSRIPNEALRSFHRQMLNRAIESLQTQTPQEKLVCSETFAVDPALLPEAEAILDRCAREIKTLSERSRAPSEIYHLGLQFFRLTLPKTKKRKS